MEPFSSVLLDIEGTTTSISFVKDVLFPYAREHLDAFLVQQWDSKECSSLMSLIRDQLSEDGVRDPDLGQVESSDLGQVEVTAAQQRVAVARHVNAWMDADRKVPALKQLQGAIWRAGYLSGHITAHVYEDVPGALQRWCSRGVTVFIYSSGSVAAQKLLFEHTAYGSLLQHLSGYFDTTTGPKTEKESYSKIAATIGCPAGQIMFVTDISKEAAAAQEAGLQTALAVRPGNAELSPSDRQQYRTVTELGQVD